MDMSEDRSVNIGVSVNRSVDKIMSGNHIVTRVKSKGMSSDESYKGINVLE